MEISGVPARLLPHLTSPVWGGDRLSRAYSRFADYKNIGEVWESSIERGAESYAIVNGVEIPFSEYLKAAGIGEFPLVKLISASSPLSIQVHPDADAAEKLGGISKSELWYVLAADPGASIMYGFADGITRDEVSRALMCGKIDRFCSTLPVRTGDVIMIPPGMIHSLGAQITVLEVQNRAGTTYRLKDIAGNRELHLREGCESVKLITKEEADSLAVACPRCDSLPGTVIAECDGFCASHVRLTSAVHVSLPIYVFVICGSAVVLGGGKKIVLTAGESAFLPDGGKLESDCELDVLLVSK